MPKLTRIAPELPASGLEKAVTWYERKLGFEVALRMPQNEYAIVERDGVAIHLFADHAKRSPVGMHIFTPDLEQLFSVEDQRRRIAQAIEQKPWGTREFRVRDEFGNELKFTEPLAE